MRRLRVGFAQFLAAPGNGAGNLETALAHVASLAGQGSELIVLPELWPSGFSWETLADDARATAESLDGLLSDDAPRPRQGCRDHVGRIHGGRRISQANAFRLITRLVKMPAREARSTRRSDSPDRVIVVLGYHEVGDDGRHGISSICRAAVRRAEELAANAKVPPRAVIFTGWSSDGGPAEADQMAEEWTGRRDVSLIREPRAVNTAENAVRSLELVRAIEGASEVVLVCSIRHFPRVRFFFGRLYRRYGYRTRYRYVVRPLPSLPLVRHELSSIARMARDRHRALRLLDEADSG